jgi:hypothetical protein
VIKVDTHPLTLTRAARRLLLAIDAGPYHCQKPLGREWPHVRKLMRRGLLTYSLRFGGVTLTSLAFHALKKGDR